MKNAVSFTAARFTCFISSVTQLNTFHLKFSMFSLNLCLFFYDIVLTYSYAFLNLIVLFVIRIRDCLRSYTFTPCANKFRRVLLMMFRFIHVNTHVFS